MKIISLLELPTEGVSHDPAITKKVMLREGELPPLSGFAQAYLAPGQIAASHVHAHKYEIFLVESGEGILRMKEQSHRLVPQTCILVEPSEDHEIASTGVTDLVLTYFGLEV